MKFGDMTPAQKKTATAEALKAFQAELDATAGQIAEVLNSVNAPAMPAIALRR